MNKIFLKTANYVLIALLCIWIIAGVLSLFISGFSVGNLVLAVMLSVVAYSVYWVFRFERFYYKLIMWVLFFNMILKIFSGYDLNIELIPFFIALYIYDHLRMPENRFQSIAA